jgi:hypothetical protein
VSDPVTPAALPIAPKAISVTQEGEPDGFEIPTAYRAEVAPDGTTRLSVSVPPERLAEVFYALAGALSSPWSVMYLQLTDRRRGKQHEGKPRRFLSVDVAPKLGMETFKRCESLLFRDARHQLWVRGGITEQLVLDEMGLVYVYPDDFSFRDLLEGLGVPEMKRGKLLCDRDYVKVQFEATADAQEALLMANLRLAEVAG